MITDELNGLIKEYNFKKDILDNHTQSIIQELKDWCVKEYKNIKKNEAEIVKFFLDNKYLVEDMRYFSYTDDTFYWMGDGLKIGGKIIKNEFRCYNFSYVSLVDKVGNREWKCNHYMTDWDNLANDDDTDIDYWVSVKNMILNFNDNINEIVKKTKNLIKSKIASQDRRKDAVLEAVKETELCKTVEIKISVVEH